MTASLRYYQNEAIDAIHSYFTLKQGNPVVGLPTGTGKSFVIGGFIQKAMSHYPASRFIVLTHVKELIQQNSEKLLEIWPQAPFGIYSAGLKQRDTAAPIIFGGVQSVASCVEDFGHRDLVLIDECHLLSPEEDTRYQDVLKRLRAINPFLKCAGFSATLFRIGQGKLTDENGLFTDICYDMTDIDGWSRLIADGFLCPLIPKRTAVELDVSHVGMYKGDFAAGALEGAVDRDSVTGPAIAEACALGRDRQSWLVFCAGIKHSEHVSAALNACGVSSSFVHSKITSKERDERIAAFKYGKLRALCGNNIFTTGFDHPPVDFIIMLRPTMSPGLWVQMLGRGTRPCVETKKQNCLVADFARNTQRLGPVNDPVIPRKKGEKLGEVPVKICDGCGTYNHARARFCVCCGNEFQFELKITKNASTEELMRSDLPIVEYFDVISTVYNKHAKKGKPTSMRVSYNVKGMRQFEEYVCFEHDGYAQHRAHEWWKQRMPSDPPRSVDEALRFTVFFKVPRRLRVWVNKIHPEILSYEY